ncbi:unnamed protein product [Boreogadus saida]
MSDFPPRLLEVFLRLQRRVLSRNPSPLLIGVLVYGRRHSQRGVRIVCTLSLSVDHSTSYLLLPTPSPNTRGLSDVMASLNVQPRLTEARPDPDTPAQIRAAVARYLAANALKDKELSTEQQRGWAVGVKVTTSLTTAAWEYTLKESEWAATRRATAKKVQGRDSVNYRKKRERYTYSLLNAYNAAISMEARKREGQPAELSPPGERWFRGLSAPSHVEERAAPLTLDRADVEDEGKPCGEGNTSLHNNTRPSLKEDPPFPTIARAPPPYGCYDHPGPQRSKDPTLQFPMLHIAKGPVDVLYNDQLQTSCTGGRQDYGGNDEGSNNPIPPGNNRETNNPTQPSNRGPNNPILPCNSNTTGLHNPILPTSNNSYNTTPNPIQPTSSSNSYNTTPNPIQPSSSSDSYNTTHNPIHPSNTKGLLNQIHPSNNSYNTTPNPIQPCNNSNNTTPNPIQPSNNSYDTTHNPIQPSNHSYDTTPNPIQPSNNSNNTTPNPIQPSNNSNSTTPNPIQPSNNNSDTTPNPIQPNSSSNRATPNPIQPSSSSSSNRATPNPVQPSYSTRGRLHQLGNVPGIPVKDDTGTGAIQKTHGTPTGATGLESRQDSSEPTQRGLAHSTRDAEDGGGRRQDTEDVRHDERRLSAYRPGPSRGRNRDRLTSSKERHAMKTRSKDPSPQPTWTPDRSDEDSSDEDVTNPRRFNFPGPHDTSGSRSDRGGSRSPPQLDFMASLMADASERETYSPWGHRDRAALAIRLPLLTAGAAAWIRKIEA